MTKENRKIIYFVCEALYVILSGIFVWYCILKAHHVVSTCLYAMVMFFEFMDISMEMSNMKDYPSTRFLIFFGLAHFACSGFCLMLIFV